MQTTYHRSLGANLCVLLLAGCAEWSSIQYEFEATPSKVVTIDAKQRVVSIYEPLPAKADDAADEKADEISKRMVVCVEQSPDVFSFLSGSFGASAEAKEAAASLAAAIAESGGSLAFRTQVTQAQSSLLNTICQMYAAGALGPQAVRTELRRFQHTLLGIMAIEQLTSPHRQMPTQQILTTSSASVGKDVEIAQTKVDQARTAKEAADAELAAAAKEVEDTKPAANQEPSEAHKAALKKKEEREKAVTKAAQELEIAEQQLKAARLALTASASGGQQAIINVYAPPNSGIDENVAGKVVEALETITYRGMLLDSCVELLLEADTSNTPSDDAKEYCNKTVTAYIDAYKMKQTAAYDLAMARNSLSKSVLDAAVGLYGDKQITAAAFTEILLELTKAERTGLEIDVPAPPMAPLGQDEAASR